MGTTVTAKGWKNKAGTGTRNCKCGSWKNHWIKFANKPWPASCSVSGCFETPTLGAHVINAEVDGERIIPMCDSCNGLSDEFDLKDGITLPYANQSTTCG